MIILSVQTFPPDSGGKQVLMESLASAAGEKHNVLVLSDKPREGRDDASVKTGHYDLQRFGGFKPFRQRRKAALIAKYVAQNNVTHLFCDSWRSAEHLPNGLNCAVTLYAHGNEYPLGGPAQNKAKAKRILKTFAKVDHIIAVSKPTAERVRAYLQGGHTPALHIINNPVSLPAPTSQEDKDFAKGLWPKREDSPVRILSLCRLIPLKGIDRAIGAVKDLVEDGYNIHMIVAGEGEDKTRLQQFVTTEKLESHIKFAGHVEGGQKTALFESADIFVQPGRKIGDFEEGFGLTYLEAGLHGLPSLCGNAGGAPEAVLHEKTGLVVNGTSQLNVTNGLRRLIDETEQTSHMGRAAMDFARSLLWDKQIDPILERVKEVRGTRGV